MHYNENLRITSHHQRGFFLQELFNKKRYRNEILANCQCINNRSADFNKIENCLYERKHEQYKGYTDKKILRDPQMHKYPLSKSEVAVQE